MVKIKLSKESIEVGNVNITESKIGMLSEN